MVLLSKYVSLEILVKQQVLEEITWSLLIGVGVWYSAGFKPWRCFVLKEEKEG